MSVSEADLETAYVDLAAFASQCAEHVRRRRGQDDAVSKQVLAELARCRGLVITYTDERVA